MGGRRQSNHFSTYLTRKPRQIPANKKKLDLPIVPLTERAIDEYGGIDRAAKKVGRVLGYPVQIKVVKTAPDKEITAAWMDELLNMGDQQEAEYLQAEREGMAEY